MTFLKGMIIGATMIVPGVSGGTMAMILGTYDRLISTISSFFKSPKSNFMFLGLFVLGAVTGGVFFATPMSWLLEHYFMPTTYFFLGAVFGGIPLIEKKSGIRKFSWDVVLYMLLGAAAVVLISAIPQEMYVAESKGMLLIAGTISAIALILPGISVSHFLLILGIYEKVLTAIKTIDFGFIAPLAFGVIVGIILFSKMLESMMNKFPRQTYLIILGFILGAAAQIFPGIPKGMHLPLCMAAVISGFGIVYYISQRE